MYLEGVCTVYLEGVCTVYLEGVYTVYLEGVCTVYLEGVNWNGRQKKEKVKHCQRYEEAVEHKSSQLNIFSIIYIYIYI